VLINIRTHYIPLWLGTFSQVYGYGYGGSKSRYISRSSSHFQRHEISRTLSMLLADSRGTAPQPKGEGVLTMQNRLPKWYKILNIKLGNSLEAIAHSSPDFDVTIWTWLSHFTPLLYISVLLLFLACLAFVLVVLQSKRVTNRSTVPPTYLILFGGVDGPGVQCTCNHHILYIYIHTYKYFILILYLKFDAQLSIYYIKPFGGISPFLDKPICPSIPMWSPNPRK